MLFMSTIKGRTNPLCQLLSRQNAIWLNNPSLAMQPLGFNRVQPRTFDRQRTNQDTDPLTGRFDLAVMGSDPSPNRLTDVPGGIIPDQGQDRFAQGSPFGATPFQKLDGNGADGSTIDETQPHLFLRFRFSQAPTNQQAITSQGFALRVIFGLFQLNQTERFSSDAPSVQVGLSKPAPPGFIFEAQEPVELAGPTDQPVTSVFFRVYSGSGLMIQRLARCQLTPIRPSVARMVSSLTRVAVKPCSKLTSAANSKVHRLVGLPKVRGLWCKISRNRSASAGPKAAWVLCGRVEPRCKIPSPRSLKLRMIFRTVWSSQPTCSAMAGACWPRALASTIWQRRSTNPSFERKPALSWSRSLFIKDRTNSGFLIQKIIPHSLLSYRSLH